ncbi:MAG: MBL fold metallo-hydrolase [Bacteroidales bacterium]|jgi:glyoxylase-like metal-dependent hydrolase (beta-lactamase superfamily II)|nr:MBL fold metallo-hydrolase [Bacteroidales bacterium]
MITIKKFVVNPIDENSFVISDSTGECVFIDPGFYYDKELSEISNYITINNLNPVKILSTHCHFDHIMGVEFIREKYKIPFQVHKDDTFLIERAIKQANMFGCKMNPLKPVDSFIEEGDKVSFGNTELEIIHVPGHSPGHLIFYNSDENFIIAGDVLFRGSIGRTDLPGGSGNYNDLISNIKNKMFSLPDETKVYCGHGHETTIGFEKNTNPFFN